MVTDVNYKKNVLALIPVIDSELKSEWIVNPTCDDN